MSAPDFPRGMQVEEPGTLGLPAIVFIHGAGQSGRVWHQHMASLTGFHRLAPDLPGFGRSNQLAWAPKVRVADLLADPIETRGQYRPPSVLCDRVDRDRSQLGLAAARES